MALKGKTPQGSEKYDGTVVQQVVFGPHGVGTVIQDVLALGSRRVGGGTKCGTVVHAVVLLQQGAACGTVVHVVVLPHG